MLKRECSETSASLVRSSAQTFPGLSEIVRRDNEAVSKRPPAVIASVFQTGLNLIRDLERRGIRAIGIDCNSKNPGFRSRYGRSYLCPNPDLEPAKWVDFMVSLAEATAEKPVLIAASDIFVAAIGRHTSRLGDHFIFSKDGALLQASLGTKQTQYALAAKYGLPSPRAAYIQSRQELEEFCKLARFPALLKPRQQREWLALPPNHPFRFSKTVSASSVEELLTHYDKVSAFVPQAVAQEEIVGPDSAKYCYLSVYSTRGHRLGACVVQELRAYPLLYGCATLVQPVIDEEIDRVCDNFLLSVGFKGLCEIELKRDTRDGQIRLIEVNPRFSGTGDAARYAGVETGYLHYLDLIGENPSPVAPTNFNFRHVMLVADFAAFPNYLAKGQIGWQEWFRSYRGIIRYFDFDPSDCLLAMTTATKSMRTLTAGLWHNIRKRKSNSR